MLTACAAEAPEALTNSGLNPSEMARVAVGPSGTAEVGIPTTKQTMGARIFTAVSLWQESVSGRLTNSQPSRDMAVIAFHQTSEC
jgi:hypothetical protein